MFLHDCLFICRHGPVGEAETKPEVTDQHPLSVNISNNN